MEKQKDTMQGTLSKTDSRWWFPNVLVSKRERKTRQIPIDEKWGKGGDIGDQGVDGHVRKLHIIIILYKYVFDM